MGKSYGPPGALFVGLFGFLAAFAGCSGSVQNPSGGGCSYEGKQYRAGDTFPSSKSCNTCQCSEQGEVICTRSACETTDTFCHWDDKQYNHGQTFSTDGCNTCTCQVSGAFTCNGQACAAGGAGPGDPDPLGCESLLSQMEAALLRAQSCKSAVECGQPIPNSSCGCTRDLVARKDADLASYQALEKQVYQLGCAEQAGSTCDCPNADGFACIDNSCTWNYVGATPEPACEPYDAAELCVRGTPTAGGERIEVGDPLTVSARSAGCLSSSCNKVVQASCAVKEGGYFSVDVTFCVATTAQPGQPCTADCGKADAKCSSGKPLTAGDHQVKLASLAVAFQVPSTLPIGGLCASTF